MKKPSERKTSTMLIPMTDAEKQQIVSAAEGDGEKPIAWAREMLLRAAKRRGMK
jgi:hypothetical protein